MDNENKILRYGMLRSALHSAVVGFDGEAPERGHAADAGLDLRADLGAQSVLARIRPKSCLAVKLATRVDIPEGYFGLLCSRSGMGMQGVGLVNGVGIIDAGYRGPVFANLYNYGDETYVVRNGDRVAQLLILPVPRTLLYDLGDAFDQLEASDRGEGGFGSTGR